jgi:hypothetical protein
MLNGTFVSSLLFAEAATGVGDMKSLRESVPRLLWANARVVMCRGCCIRVYVLHRVTRSRLCGASSYRSVCSGFQAQGQVHLYLTLKLGSLETGTGIRN